MWSATDRGFKGIIMQNTRPLSKLIVLLVVSLCAVALLLGCANDEQPASDAAQSSAQGSDQEVLEVEDIHTTPASFQHDVIVTGTVTTFSERDAVALIGVVDNQHILECLNLECPGYKIYAVNVSGKDLPDPGDVITMVGSFQAMGDFWIFSISDYVTNSNIMDRLQ